jgi:hypothetical protein
LLIAYPGEIALGYRDERRIVLREQPRCIACDRKLAKECHHIVPVRFGGKDGAENLAGMCHKCHKQVHVYYEFYGQIAYFMFSGVYDAKNKRWPRTLSQIGILSPEWFWHRWHEYLAMNLQERKECRKDPMVDIGDVVPNIISLSA